MSVLPSARLVRLGQWLQSALLHGFLLLCLVAYHWHRHGSLSFSADNIHKISTDNLSTLSTYNAHFLDVFIEQSESTEPHPTAVKLIEAPSDEKVEIATDLLADTKVVVKNDTHTEAKKKFQCGRGVVASGGGVGKTSTHATCIYTQHTSPCT